MANILVIDNDAAVRGLFQTVLESAGHAGGLNAERMVLLRQLQTEFHLKTGGHGPVVFDGAAMNGQVEEKPNAHRGVRNENDRIMNGDAIVKPGILAERPSTRHARHCILAVYCRLCSLRCNA